MDFPFTIIFITACSISVGNFADPACVESEGAQSLTLTLIKMLFCDYDKNIQPVKNHTAITEVGIYLRPKMLDFYDFDDVLQVHSWMTWNWTDETLSWNKTQYDIDVINVPSDTLWLPDLDIDESNDNEQEDHHVKNIQCLLYSTGQVLCPFSTVHSALCDADIRRWPFDSHKCTMTVQSWARAENLNLTLTRNEISTILYQKGRVWDLINATVVRKEFVVESGVEASKVIFYFELKRFSGEGAAGVVIPAILLAVLTWLTFLLKATSAERLSVIGANILCHCAYLVHISSRIPHNGDSIPLILLFYRDSLFMVVASLIITLVVRKMDVKSSSPPIWITGVVNGILATLPGQMLLLSGVDTKGVAAVVDAGNAEGSGTQRWRVFGAIVDYFSLFICVVATFVLIIRFMP